MLLTKYQQVAGVPGSTAKHIMFKLGFECEKSSLLENVAKSQKTTPQQASVWIEALITAGYIADNGNCTLIPTLSGNRLRLARIGKPISRIEANDILSQVIHRVTKINSDENTPYIISSLSVFGSYLTDTDFLGDLDIAYSTDVTKIIRDSVSVNNDIKNAAISRLNNLFCTNGIAPGRGPFGQIKQSELYIKRMLGGRDNRLSLHTISEVESLGCEYRILELT